MSKPPAPPPGHAAPRPAPPPARQRRKAERPQELLDAIPTKPEENDRLTVGMDGTVAPKLVGTVTVGGLTVAEATARLKQRYAGELKSPELSILMRRYSPARC